MGVFCYNVSKSGRSDSVRTLMEEIMRDCGEVTSGMLCHTFHHCCVKINLREW